jgi:hypothetical protein
MAGAINPQQQAEIARRKKAATTATGPSMIGTANSAPNPNGQPGMTPTTPPENLPPAPSVGAMTPADQLLSDAKTRGIGQAGQTSVARADAGSAGLNALQGQILATPGQSPAQALDAAQRSGLGAATQAGFSPLTTGRQPVTGRGAVAPTGLAPTGLYQQPNAGPLATGTGQGSIDEVDAALTGYNPNFNVPGTGALGALPGMATMGALPGATDRNLQMGALDRLLAYDPSVGSSVAEAQLRDATQRNLGQSLALARSARGGPAAQAQALRMAQAEGAATMSQQARDLALVRAKEEDTRKQRELDALGLGGDISGAIRGSDVLERQQNVGALEADLNAKAQQRGQTIGAQETERNAGVTERGQTLAAQEAQKRAVLDALVARGGLAQTERQVGSQERGQTLDAILGTEQVKQARDAVASAALSDSEKTEAMTLVTAAQLGYELTPEQKIRLANMAKKANDPTALQYILTGLQAGAAVGNTVAAFYTGGATAPAAVSNAAGATQTFTK